MDPKVIAENIRRHREKCHWTQEELAIAADIDTRTVQRAERGQRVRVILSKPSPAHSTPPLTS